MKPKILTHLENKENPHEVTNTQTVDLEHFEINQSLGNYRNVVFSNIKLTQ